MPSDRDTLTSTLRSFGLERDRLWAVLARHSGIGTSDLTALEQLDVNGPTTQRALASRLGLTDGSVTLLVDRLQRAGWVDRYPNASDRRERLIELAVDSRDELPSGLAEYYRAMQVLARRIHGDLGARLTEFLGDAAIATANVATKYR